MKNKGIRLMIDKIENSHVNEDLNRQIEKKKTYVEPRVSKLGSMQKVTLGGSEICEDSGQGAGTGLNCQ